MKLQDILLRKQEIPITNQTCFMIPVHPRLLDSSINFNSNIAQEIFPQIAQDWYEDLSKYANELQNSEEHSWIKDVFLKKRPVVKKERGKQILDNCWTDQVAMNDNDLATDFCISRNAGGSLYFVDNRDHIEAVSLSRKNRYFNFSYEKIREFSSDINQEKDLAKIKVYRQHNVDNYPGALFLRNWVLEYMNRVLMEVV
ncbi:MAG: hypothetical protein ACOCUU_01720 [Nanoarchaeota archaeon]